MAADSDNQEATEDQEELLDPQDNDPWAEKRKYPRTGVIWVGTFETPIEKIECSVLNLSANGAKLQLNAAMTFKSNSGTLHIPHVGSFDSKVAWSAPESVNQIGVMFLDPPAEVAQKLAGVLPKSRASGAAT